MELSLKRRRRKASAQKLPAGNFCAKVPVATRALGVTQQQLHRVLSGESGISPEMAVHLEMAIGSTADFRLRLQGNYDLAQVRQRADKIEATKLRRPEVA